MARKAVTPKTGTGIDDVRERLNEIVGELNAVFVERTPHIAALMMTTLAGEHLLFVGDPGTGKTALCKVFASHITGANYWKRTLGSFTPPEKIVGPLDIKAFQNGTYRHQIDGALPAADLAMIDELFKGSQVVNEMLDILGPEREFDHAPIPLISAAAASNWPEVDRRDDITAALYDRFLTRVVVERVRTRDGRVAVMKAMTKVKSYKARTTVTVDELRTAVVLVEGVAVSDAIYEVMADLIGTLAPSSDKKGIEVSERRAGHLIKMLQASAWLAGREDVAIEDFGVLEWGLWEVRDDIESVCAALGTIDAAAVKEIVDHIDRGRTAYNECKASNWGNARVNRAMATIRDVGTEVHRLFDRPIFTDGGRAKVRRAMDALKRDFDNLKANSQGKG